MYASVVCLLSDDADFLWRLARAARDLALEPNVEAEQKKQLTYEAFENAKKALEKDDESFAVHKVMVRRSWSGCLSHFGLFLHVLVLSEFINTLRDCKFYFRLNILPLLTQWYAICLSDIGDYEGVKVKIGNSYIIRDHLEVRGQFGSVSFYHYVSLKP